MAVCMKKKRLAALQASKKQKALAAQQEPPKKTGGFLGIADCDLGASPQMSKGAIYSKKDGGGGKESPLYQAAQQKYKLIGRRN